MSSRVSAATRRVADLDDQRDQRASRRSGSAVSDRQIGQAAARGRQVTFQYFSTQPAHELTGYVVGMDDYHWMIASPMREATDGDLIAITLVHKARVDLIRLLPTCTLDEEPEDIRAALTKTGQAFWRYCESTYSGR